MDNLLQPICVAISKIRAAENSQIFSGPRFSYWVLFGIFAVCTYPVLCGFQKIRQNRTILAGFSRSVIIGLGKIQSCQ